MKKLLLLTLLLPVVSASCKKEAQEDCGDNAIVINSSSDKGVDEIKTKAPADELDSYWLTIDGPAGYNFTPRELGTGSDRTVSGMVAGEYTVTLVSRKPGTYTLPFMNLPIYGGSLKKEVSGATNFSFTCYQINTGIKFVFDPTLTAAYPNAVATVTADGGAGSSLAFTQANATADDVAYFDPETLRITLADGSGNTIPIGGKIYQDIEVAARELWTVTLKITPATNSIVMDVSVSDVVTPREVEFEAGDLTGTGAADSPFSVAQAIKSLPADAWVEGYILGFTSLTPTRAGESDYVRIGLRPGSDPAQGIVVTNLREADIRAELGIPSITDLIGTRMTVRGKVEAKPGGVTAPGLAVMTMKAKDSDFSEFTLNYFSDLYKSVSYYCLNTIDKPNTVLKNALPGLKIGTAVRHEQLAYPAGWDSDPTYINILKRDFNSITAEYNMKMDVIWGSENDYPAGSFTGADGLVQFAKENRMRVHGHTLIWPEVVPQWLKTKGQSENWDQAKWTEVMETYITNVITHFTTKYPGVVQSWDVVNEAFGPDGTLWGDTSYPNNNNFWYDKVGPDFIQKAFVAAKAALKAAGDTQCKLFYNDYDIVSDTDKRDGIHSYFATRLSGGYDVFPIDGIGMQCHVLVRPDYQKAKESFAKMASLKHTNNTPLLIHLSELDAQINNSTLVNELNGGSFYTSWWQTGVKNYWDADYAQGKSFNMIACAYLDNVPSAQRHGITTWGISDRYSMTGTNNAGEKDWAVLFTKANEPKSAYNGLLEALLGVDWYTEDGNGSNWQWRWDSPGGFAEAPIY